MYKAVACLTLLIVAYGCGTVSAEESQRREKLRPALEVVKRGDLIIIVGDDGKDEVWAVVSNPGGEEVKVTHSLGSVILPIYPQAPSRSVRGVCGKGQMPEPVKCREMFFNQ